MENLSIFTEEKKIILYHSSGASVGEGLMEHGHINRHRLISQTVTHWKRSGGQYRERYPHLEGVGDAIRKIDVEKQPKKNRIGAPFSVAARICN